MRNPSASLTRTNQLYAAEGRLGRNESTVELLTAWTPGRDWLFLPWGGFGGDVFSSITFLWMSSTNALTASKGRTVGPVFKVAWSLAGGPVECRTLISMYAGPSKPSVDTWAMASLGTWRSYGVLNLIATSAGQSLWSGRACTCNSANLDPCDSNGRSGLKPVYILETSRQI